MCARLISARFRFSGESTSDEACASPATRTYNAISANGARHVRRTHRIHLVPREIHLPPFSQLSPFHEFQIVHDLDSIIYTKHMVKVARNVW